MQETPQDQVQPLNVGDVVIAEHYGMSMLPFLNAPNRHTILEIEEGAYLRVGLNHPKMSFVPMEERCVMLDGSLLFKRGAMKVLQILPAGGLQDVERYQEYLMAVETLPQLGVPPHVSESVSESNEHINMIAALMRAKVDKTPTAIMHLALQYAGVTVTPEQLVLIAAPFEIGLADRDHKIAKLEANQERERLFGSSFTSLADLLAQSSFGGLSDLIGSDFAASPLLIGINGAAAGLCEGCHKESHCHPREEAPQESTPDTAAAG